SELLQREKYASREHDDLASILRDFMAKHGIAAKSVQRVCAGIAGPIVDGHVETPNLPWSIDAKELQRALGVREVTLINDLEATAERAATLGAGDVHELNPGRRPPGTLTNGAVIAAGTGLGMAV